MNEEEIQEALKIIKEPITVNSIEYKYFDQENYEKLLRVYENCQWFINIHEQLIQNLDNLHQELDHSKNNWEELKGYIKKFPGISYASSEKVDGERLSGKLIPVTKVLNKMKELEEVK